MAMTRKHYREAAEIIKEQITLLEGETSDGERLKGFYPNGEAHDRLQAVAEGLARMFAADNSAFNRQKFMEACGL